MIRHADQVAPSTAKVDTNFADKLQILVGLEQGPLSLVSTTEELLEGRKVAAPVYKTENTTVGIRHADHVAPSIRKR
jgi:hypothetical protein